MKKSTVLLLIGCLYFASTAISQHENDSVKKKGNENVFHHEEGVGANEHMHKHSIESMASAFESEERAKWQKPDEVIQLMGDLNGKTVMDLGSGTGYFSFRLAKKGAKVICADVDDRFINIIEERKNEEGWTDEQIEIRKVPYDSPELSDGEVDAVLIVNTYHHIENRETYFVKVKRGLKPNGKLYNIDFLKKEVPIGPPMSMKISESEVIGELLEAGFTKFEVNSSLLPYQYIIVAW
jgi:ubiquinone/menaquinone biosynthesis C-methylase UbiE